MKILVKCFFVAIALGLVVGVNGQPFSKKVRRVLFLGNSITYEGTYVTVIEGYLIQKYPQQQIEFINVGLPSETVSGLSEPGHADGQFARPDLHERLDRVLAMTRPDVVFACYGMNDGIYLPFDEGRFQKYKDGIHWLHDEVVKRGARIIHLTPPVYDETRGGSVGYAAVLDKYSEWLIRQREVVGWEVADLHFPMKSMLESLRADDAGFAFAQDGIHPGEAGHKLMAREVLKFLGERPTLEKQDLVHDAVYKLVTERQKIMKDAWLTAIGHKRPGMAKGIPLDEAKAKYAEIEKQIRK